MWRMSVPALAMGGIDGAAKTWDPELSPVRSEWYFEPDTVKNISALLHGRVLCVGAPTVAELYATAGREVTLIDNCPWVGRRIPAVASIWREGDFHNTEVPAGIDSVLLDPPWYLPEALWWLDRALRSVSPGGSVFLPLFGELTRPSAKRERDILLEHAESFGWVTIDRESVAYETPLFEREALRAAGLPIASPWRRADLVRVVRRDEMGTVPAPDPGTAPDRDEWVDYVIGSQVVALRTRNDPDFLDGAPTLRPVVGVENHVLDTVSARDPRVATVDLWTSRNRVARVTGAESLKALLVELQSYPSGDLLEKARTRHGAALLDELLLTLGLPGDVDRSSLH